ncbi:hypothetical protein KKH43_03255 [Patescibacteria group bacterium]|nr:hypothetical protein [Patescibacteria group bacterium]
MKTIAKQYEEILKRPTRGIVHFNDVFSKRDVDFDAELTAITRNLGNFSDVTFPIGQDHKLADYGVNLLHDLIAEQNRIINSIRDRVGKMILQNFTEKVVLSVVNCAPRNSKTTANGRNGEDFHLAITDNGLEIYAVPLAILQALETRDKILALYRIPNEKLKVTDGLHEQFRSSIIATTRYFPEILEPIFEYQDRNSLINAKLLGKHPDVIPKQKKLAEFAFADTFGNVRISVKDTEIFKSYFGSGNIGDVVKMRVGKSKSVDAYYTTSLKEIPDGELGIYQNVADNDNSKASYWEIVKKWSVGTLWRAEQSLEELNPNFRNEEIVVTEKQ